MAGQDRLWAGTPGAGSGGPQVCSRTEAVMIHRVDLGAAHHSSLRSRRQSASPFLVPAWGALAAAMLFAAGGGTPPSASLSDPIIVTAEHLRRAQHQAQISGLNKELERSFRKKPSDYESEK